ncbi:MAG: hypothetical protein A2033_10480 [Bacteroidetes bacterium GWA2_31_9]|nr:MAG: hypothetical protein A2033_10480 [Bacteroidetes bacterium GWA2_31_9]
MEISDTIIETAIERFLYQTKIKIKWNQPKGNKPNKDGIITIYFPNKEELFIPVIKKEFTNIHFYNLEKNYKEKNPRIVIIAEHINPNIREKLRNLNICYMDVAGNTFVKTPDHIIFLDGFKNTNKITINKNRAFTKTGLKVSYNLLINPELLNTPYRNIAREADVALDTINKTFTALKELGYIINLTPKTYILANKKKLFEQWVNEYENKLKPTLFIGMFRYPKNEDIKKWKDFNFNDDNTFWGGEPAAGILTKYLYPEIFTIYTTLTKTELIKKYKLIPDANGNVIIYRKFWNTNTDNPKVAQIELIYADLINTTQGRNIETANIIYDEYLKNKYE